MLSRSLAVEIDKREEYKQIDPTYLLRFLTELTTVYGFALTKYSRKRDNYHHLFAYEMKFEKHLPRSIKYELFITHEGYINVNELLDELKTWLETTNKPDTVALSKMMINITPIPKV